MNYGDIIYCLDRALSLYYIQINGGLPKLMEYYDNNKTKAIAAMNDLMLKGNESDTFKYWDGTQTIINRINTGQQ